MALLDLNIGPDGNLDKDEPFIDISTARGFTRYLYGNLVSEPGSVEVNSNYGVGISGYIGKFIFPEIRDEIREKINHYIQTIDFLNLQGLNVEVRLMGERRNPIIYIFITTLLGEKYLFSVRYDKNGVYVESDYYETNETDVEEGVYDILYERLSDDVLNRL